MKDLSLFLLKYTMTAKMRKGFKSFCNGDGSTSTLNQQKDEEVDNTTEIEAKHDDKHNAITLEEMIMQLESEEKSMDKFSARILEQQRRMSCVNSSDILRSARNALNQYPRFSLDGKDAMYRSSFRNFGGTHRNATNYILKNERQFCSCNHVDSKTGGQKLQPAIAGDESCSVVWCKPGVVAKLMGLEAMPIPVLQLINNNKMIARRRSTSSAVDNNFKKQNQLPRNRGRGGAVSHKRSGTSDNNYCLDQPRSRITNNYVMIRKHEVTNFDEPGWPLRHHYL